MRILLSNDDGIHANGLQCLYDVLSDIADVTVVAPNEEKSATGQTLTLDHPVRIEEVKKDFYAVNGFPADCTLLGILHVMDQKPDLVISGINRGANLAQDIYYSGTVAAARQAVFHGVKAIAVSTVLDHRPLAKEDIHYLTAANFVKNLIVKELHHHIGEMSLLNINVPDCHESEVKNIEVTRLGQRQYSERVERRLDSRNREYFWIGGDLQPTENTIGSDCYVVDNKGISISPLNLLTDSSDTVSKWTEIINTAY
jgi:5'-nucleotidase